MERLGMTCRLRTGKKETYIKAHQEIWPEMQDLLRRGGVKQMTIFMRGDTLFLFAEIEDLEAYQALTAADPVSLIWESWMATLLDQPFDKDEPGIFAQLEEVFHFDTEQNS